MVRGRSRSSSSASIGEDFFSSKKRPHDVNHQQRTKFARNENGERQTVVLRENDKARSAAGGKGTTKQSKLDDEKPGRKGGNGKQNHHYNEQLPEGFCAVKVKNWAGNAQEAKNERNQEKLKDFFADCWDSPRPEDRRAVFSVVPPRGAGAKGKKTKGKKSKSFSAAQNEDGIPIAFCYFKTNAAAKKALEKDPGQFALNFNQSGASSSSSRVNNVQTNYAASTKMNILPHQPDKKPWKVRPIPEHCYTVVVKNLRTVPETSSESLRQHFSVCGAVQEASLRWIQCRESAGEKILLGFVYFKVRRTRPPGR
ncbi:unnamed protein product [Amoebophrya sp. A120]|nr:unnamed protein product [Amoebophrya sp. A120]|eukprot:GSA120T00017697001.1